MELRGLVFIFAYASLESTLTIVLRESKANQSNFIQFIGILEHDGLHRNVSMADFDSR